MEQISQEPIQNNNIDATTKNLLERLYQYRENFYEEHKEMWDRIVARVESAEMDEEREGAKTELGEFVAFLEDEEKDRI